MTNQFNCEKFLSIKKNRILFAIVGALIFTILLGLFILLVLAFPKILAVLAVLCIFGIIALIMYAFVEDVYD